MIEYYKEKDIGIAENAPQLTAALGISPVLAELLCARGYDTVEKAKEYLDPVGCSLQPPMTIKGMREAVDTVLNAMAQDKLICVFGDYDVDGIMAVTILSRFLKEQGVQLLHTGSFRFHFFDARIQTEQAEQFYLDHTRPPQSMMRSFFSVRSVGRPSLPQPRAL